MKNDYKLDPMDARAVAWWLNQEDPNLHVCKFITYVEYAGGFAEGDTALDAIVALYEQEVLEPARRQLAAEGDA
jgi:hypothetical protein